MKKIIVSLTIALFASIFFLIACSSEKDPAELAIKTAEQAVEATKVSADKIIPDQLKELENSLASAKEKMVKKEYKEALAEATTLIAKAKDVRAAAKDKKDELTQKWTALSQELPKMAEALQNRVNTLSKAKKLPAKLTKEKFAEVKAELDSMKEEWTKAQESFKNGSFMDAVNVATSLKDKVAKSMEDLGISAPAPAPVPEATQKTKVVGNRDSKRYHLQGMKYYNAVESYHRIEFDSEADAIKAGYQKAPK